MATNTALHTSDPTLAGKLTWANHGTGDGRVVLEESLVDYVQYCQRAPELVASTFLYAASGTLTPEVLAAYDAPFPDRSFTAGLRQMTALIPLTRNDPGAAHGTRHHGGARRVGTAPSSPPSPTATPPPGDGRRCSRRRVPGAAGHAHPTIRWRRALRPRGER